MDNDDSTEANPAIPAGPKDGSIFRKDSTLNRSKNGTLKSEKSTESSNRNFSSDMSSVDRRSYAFQREDEEKVPCSSDSAFGSEETSNSPLGTETIRPGIARTISYRSKKTHASKIEVKSQTVARSQGPTWVRALQTHPHFLRQDGAEGVRASVMRLKFKAFNQKEKSSWLGEGRDESRGFIRLYDSSTSLKCSLVIPCTLDTTCGEVCTKLGLLPDSMHLQLSGENMKRLESSEHPLLIQQNYLERMGIADVEWRKQLGDTISLGYLIRFYAGRPQFDDGYGGQKLSAFCHVRKGRVFHYWTRRLCILDGSRVFIYPCLDKVGDPEVLSIARAKVEEVHLKSRGRCIKIRVTHPRKPAFSVYLAFDAMLDLNAWLARCVQAAAKIPPISDLSNLQLERLPEQVFCVGSERLLTQLNLRRNHLRERPTDAEVHSSGWLEDLVRLPSLRSLTLSDNGLPSLPSVLPLLPALTHLNLASNRIPYLPPHISKLKNLQCLNMQNNRLSQLPPELAECESLQSLDLSFNLFSALPPILLHLPALHHWTLAGNHIPHIQPHALLKAARQLSTLDLSRNGLSRSEAIPIGCLTNLTQLNVTCNPEIESLDLRSLHSLHSLQCERSRIRTLQLNGSSLRYLRASHNEIESITVMPIPQHLKLFDASRNQLTKVPQWLAEISHISEINVSHNNLSSLPHRIFTNVSSLRRLILHHNELRSLPVQVENCYIEVLDLHHNKLTHLPQEFLASTHKLRELNVSQNALSSLPPLNPFQDLNKVTHLVLSSNRFGDSVLHIVCGYRRLKTLDLAYNHLRALDHSDLVKLDSLEELNVSGNRLVELPEALGRLPKITMVKAHSNKLVSIPNFSRCSSLKVLDLGSNGLETIDVRHFLAPCLKHLDLSCNPRLRLDTSAFHQFENERDVSMIDMSQTHGANRPAESTEPERTLTSTEVPWQVGFSETSGERNKLCITQIRHTVSEPKLGSRCGALFGIVDGGLNNQIPIKLQKLLRALIATNLDSNSPAERALLAAHLALEGSGQKMGAACALCHIIPSESSLEEGKEWSSEEDIGYRLNVANVGHTQAVVCRKGKPYPLTRDFSVQKLQPDDGEYIRLRDAGGIITQEEEINGVSACSRMLGSSFLHPMVIPQPHSTNLDLGGEDEFLIMASRGLWDRMDPSEAVRRIRFIPNPILAAKHLQDIAQSYGFLENLSIIVVRFFFSAMPSPLPFPHPHVPIGVPKTVARSAVDLAEYSDEMTDDEIHSEPRHGKVKREKPNYYFEYKKKLKELLMDSDSSTSSTQLSSSVRTLLDDEDVEDGLYCSVSTQEYPQPKNYSGRSPSIASSRALSQSVQSELSGGQVEGGKKVEEEEEEERCISLESIPRPPPLPQILPNTPVKRHKKVTFESDVPEGSVCVKGKNGKPQIVAVNVEDLGNFSSKIRFEHARRQVMQKLSLRARPPSSHAETFA